MKFSHNIKKMVFDIAKRNKGIRVFLRGGRDALYHARMVADEPFGEIDDKLVYFQTFPDAATAIRQRPCMNT